MVGALVAMLGVLAGCGTGSSTPPPAPPSTPTLAPTATPAPTALFQDPLTSNANGWASDQYCSFHSDGYHIKGGAACFAPVNMPADANVSVQAKQISGAQTRGYGLLVRGSVANNALFGYDFLIVGQGAWAFLKESGSSTHALMAFTTSSAIKQGLNATNTLEVRMAGSHFDLFINGQQVGQADDSSYVSGFTGLWGNAGIEVVYSNFEVTVAPGTASILPGRRPSVMVMLPTRLDAVRSY